MISVCPANERVKRQYFEYQREVLGLAEKTIDHAARAIFDFERFTGGEDFKKWSLKKAMAYKKQVMTGASRRQGAVTSRATVVSKLRLLKNFFLWLATQPGYRSKISRAEAEYLAPNRHDSRVARAPSARPSPTLEQARHVILSMPAKTDVELRDRALVACALLTGARVGALITLKLRHVRADRLGIEQDPNDGVRTKFSKSQTTFFFRVGDDIRDIFLGYVEHLEKSLFWGAEDPLFPATYQTVGADHQFSVQGLKRAHWKTTDPVRHVFRRAFAAAEVPYFSPHSFRNCLMNMAERLCRTPLELKAFSLNLGHDDVRTSLTSYGAITLKERADVISRLGAEEDGKIDQLAALLNDSHLRAKLKGLLS